MASKAMLVRGTVQIGDGGVVSLLADRLRPLCWSADRAEMSIPRQIFVGT